MKYSKAAIASGVVAVIVTLALLFISSGGRLYMSEVDWGQVNSMNYEEGQQYLTERSKEISRWESLKNGVGYSQFWLSAIADWLTYFSIGFVSCFVFFRLSQYRNV